MKTNMWWEMDGWYDAGETLRRGKGTCNHLNNAYVALCRCAGIKAQILNFNVQFGDTAQEVLTPDPILSSFMNNSGGVIPETEAEVLIDGAWTPAYIPQNILLTACSG
jgi:transglutaminase-like putative cysteine protease